MALPTMADNRAQTAEDLAAWARRHRALAARLRDARVRARTTRAAVDAYIAPIFARFAWAPDARWSNAAIMRPSDLYLTDRDDPAVRAELDRFYAACDAAHREHGYDLPAGVCPALRAEHEVIQVENALITAAIPLFGPCRIEHLGQHRAEYLRLLLDACAVADREAQTRRWRAR